MEVPALYRLPADPGPDFADLTVAGRSHLASFGVPSQAGGGGDCAAAEDRLRWKQQQANLHCQAQRLQGHRYKVDLQPPNQGEVALLGKAGKDFWLVLADRAVLGSSTFFEMDRRDILKRTISG